MSAHDTDKHWEEFGRLDPYYGVISDPKYLSHKLNDKARDEFFASGREHVARISALFKEKLQVDLTPRRSLDFGCGVGRVLIPLADLSDETIGVDVSPSMLTEARANISERRLDNVQVVECDDSLSNVHGSFDFIHSFIVFQHIRPARGELIIERLLQHLAPEGVAALHVTYGVSGVQAKAINFAHRRVPFASQVFNLLRGRAWSYPTMEMNEYSIPRLIDIFGKQGIDHFYAETTDHGGYLGFTFFLHRRSRRAVAS